MGTTRDDRRTIAYRAPTHDLADPMRDVEVHASRAEIDHVVSRRRRWTASSIPAR